MKDLQTQALSEQDPVIKSSIEVKLVYVFLRLTVFMKEAGYHELSMALWQAVLELCVMRPPGVETDAAMASLEEFWDSEAPRLGERGYLPWISRQQQDAPAPKRRHSMHVRTTNRIFKHFILAELDRASETTLPGRTTDESDASDPFNVVLFSDIQPVVLLFSQGTISHRLLILGFLRYYGLPMLPNTVDANIVAWWDDPLLSSCSIEPHAFATEDQVGILDGLDFPARFQSYHPSTETLFSRNSTLYNFHFYETAEPVLSTLLQAVPGDEDLAECYLILVYLNEPTR